MTYKNQLCALIGNPVEHSLSPVIHNSAFEDKGLGYEYLAFKVKPENLKAAINGARALNFKGLNVTVPYKVDVMPLLDKVDPVCQRIGAVNTIVNTNGALKGYNTDAAGFLKALESQGINPAGKEAVIIGAGGAAMAVADALAYSGSTITFLNRPARLDEVTVLAEKLSRESKQQVVAMALNEVNLSASLKTADILINATSVGMAPKTNQTLVPSKLLR